MGDLHLDPRFMDDHIEGREHFKKIFANEMHKNLAVVSLGDLGESKSVSPETTSELFAGTTACFELSRDYLTGFGAPFEVRYFSNAFRLLSCF